jgi:hypothetical protein
VCDLPSAGVISSPSPPLPGEHWIDMSNPLRSGFTRSYGGPGVGGHTGDSWPISFGMDLGAEPGTPLYAAFEGTITGWFMDRIDEKGPPRYGAQVTITSPDGKIAAFYTHFRDLPAGFKRGYKVDRGEYMGTISPTTGAPHVHFAIAENVGGTFQGVNLYDYFLSSVNSDDISSVTFFGDGRKPEPGQARKPKEFSDEHYEQRRHLGRRRATLLQRQIGNRAMAAALASPMLLSAAAAVDARAAEQAPVAERSDAAVRERSQGG